jgi:hypothetical protein
VKGGSIISPGLDFMLQVARGKIPGITHVNKFGTTTNADSGVVTDIWDGANPTDDDDIWSTPTAARIHTLVSTSDNDGKTQAPNSTGARTVRVYGLTSWDTAETSEVVTLDGTTGVTTTNSYVIIHRMVVETFGASGPNVGYIDCTAAVDGTITAMILPSLGQTQMCVYGIPSTQVGYMTNFYAHIDKAGGGATAIYADLSMWWTQDVENAANVWTLKQDASLSIFGSSGFQHFYKPPKVFAGPGVVKLQTTSSANDMEVSGGFDIILVDN